MIRKKAMKVAVNPQPDGSYILDYPDKPMKPSKPTPRQSGGRLPLVIDLETGKIEWPSRIVNPQPDGGWILDCAPYFPPPELNELIAAWGSQRERTTEEREAARKFCARSPDRPRDRRSPQNADDSAGSRKPGPGSPPENPVA